MPINFPDTPTNGDTHTEGNRSWVYNSSTNSWEGGLSTVTGSMASQSANGVAITGGTITGLTNLTTSSATITGGTITGLTNLATASLSASGNVSVGGNLTVDTNTLFVDSVNNRVGIGTTSPSYKLDVNGTASFAGNVSMLGTLTVTTSIECLTASGGIILKSPNGTRWRITVDDAGGLISTSL